MKIEKITTSKSSNGIIEKHKELIPTIVYYNDPAGLLTLNFKWWKWWFKILIFYKK